VFHNANQATVTSVALTLAFNSELFDQDGLGTSTQASGGALNVVSTAHRSPEFMMVRVG
jgi:hypothetical protein